MPPTARCFRSGAAAARRIWCRPVRRVRRGPRPRARRGGDRRAHPVRRPAHPLHLALGGPVRPPSPEVVLLTSAQQLGSASRTLELAVQHARAREQFGRPIGSFQAVKHLCADMLLRVERARTAVYAAAVTGDRGETASAKVLADEAAGGNARDCLQIFGGMGFTWEAEVHLHIKRSWVLAARCGGAGAYEEVLAERCSILMRGDLSAMSHTAGISGARALISGCVRGVTCHAVESRPGSGTLHQVRVVTRRGNCVDLRNGAPRASCCPTLCNEPRMVCSTDAPLRWNMQEALVGVTAGKSGCAASRSRSVSGARREAMCPPVRMV